MFPCLEYSSVLFVCWSSHGLCSHYDNCCIFVLPFFFSLSQGMWVGIFFLCCANTAVVEDGWCKIICLQFWLGFAAILTLVFGIGYWIAILWSVGTIANSRKLLLWLYSVVSQAGDTSGPFYATLYLMQFVTCRRESFFSGKSCSLLASLPFDMAFPRSANVDFHMTQNGWSCGRCEIT